MWGRAGFSKISDGNCYSVITLQLAPRADVARRGQCISFRRGERVCDGRGTSIPKVEFEAIVGQLREQRANVHDRAHDSELAQGRTVAGIGRGAVRLNPKLTIFTLMGLNNFSIVRISLFSINFTY